MCLNIPLDTKTSFKSHFWCNFIMESVSPVYFYLNYIYCGNLLKSHFGYTSEQVISHNLIIGIFNFINAIILTILCHKFHPLKILRVKLFFFIPFILAFPVCLDNLHSSNELLILQILFFFAFYKKKFFI